VGIGKSIEVATAITANRYLEMAMSGILESLSAFISKLTPFVAGVAFAGGGASTLWLYKRFDLDGTQTALTLVCMIGVWGLNGLALARIGRGIRRVRNYIEAVSERFRRQRNAVQNFEGINRDEMEALEWLYHRFGQRVRVNGNVFDIGSLITHGILIPEGLFQPYNDIWCKIPSKLFRILEERLGPRYPPRSGGRPPWDR
jgi:hypothetical protein